MIMMMMTHLTLLLRWASIAPGQHKSSSYAITSLPSQLRAIVFFLICYENGNGIFANIFYLFTCVIIYLFTCNLFKESERESPIGFVTHHTTAHNDEIAFMPASPLQGSSVEEMCHA